MACQGWMTPVSLLAAITETAANVPESMRPNKVSISTSPLLESGNQTTREPNSALAASMTLGCSVGLIPTQASLDKERAQCRITALFDSVAPEVKITRSGETPKCRASDSRAAS